jgi:hypothetical protein
MRGHALEVGEGRQHEEQPRDEEDDRRQAERVRGDHAKREVDRRPDRAVSSREETRRAEAALDRDECLPRRLRDGLAPSKRRPGSIH